MRVAGEKREATEKGGGRSEKRVLYRSSSLHWYCPILKIQHAQISIKDSIALARNWRWWVSIYVVDCVRWWKAPQVFFGDFLSDGAGLRLHPAQKGPLYFRRSCKSATRFLKRVQLTKTERKRGGENYLLPSRSPDIFFHTVLKEERTRERGGRCNRNPGFPWCNNRP